MLKHIAYVAAGTAALMALVSQGARASNPTNQNPVNSPVVVFGGADWSVTSTVSTPTAGQTFTGGWVFLPGSPAPSPGANVAFSGTSQAFGAADPVLFNGEESYTTKLVGSMSWGNGNNLPAPPAQNAIVTIPNLGYKWTSGALSVSDTGFVGSSAPNGTLNTYAQELAQLWVNGGGSPMCSAQATILFNVTSPIF